MSKDMGVKSSTPYYKSDSEFYLANNGNFYVKLQMMESWELENFIPSLTDLCAKQTGFVVRFSDADVCRNGQSGDLAIFVYFEPVMQSLGLLH
jgi:hypothetical protein